MTAPEMLARCRTILDESSAGYWTDAEIYSALSDGQNAIINAVWSAWDKKTQIAEIEVPVVLRPLQTVVVNLAFGTTGTTSVALPADFAYDLHVEYDDNADAPIASFKRGESKNRKFSSENTYLHSTQAQYYHYFDGANLNFETAISGTGAYRLTYLKKPTDIASGVAPAIGFEAHKAIVYYAVTMMLFKDKSPDAMNIFQIYINELKDLI